MCVFEMYKMAVEGRNEHYKYYNAWVNLYSIFTGALFVAYYTTAGKDKPLLSLVIALAGTFASLCWYLSVMGFYSWMVSWISVVHDYEDRLNDCWKSCRKNDDCPQRGSCGIECYVYSVFKDAKGNQEHVSTQKVTKCFVVFLCVMWNVLAVSACFPASKLIKGVVKAYLSNLMLVDAFLVLLFLMMVFLEIWFVSTCRKERLLSSIDGMKGDIYG